MKENVPVNFETYYFWELLNAIEARGKEQYGNNELTYLLRFLSTLRQEDDAFQNITRLAGSNITSDFALFFNDILDRIRTLEPTDAFKKIDEYAQDFLETFGLLIEEGDWKTALDAELGTSADEIQPRVTAEQEPPTMLDATSLEEEESVSYQQFIQQSIQEKLEQKTTQLPPEQQTAVQQFFQHSLTQPDFTDKLLEQELDETVPEWVDILASVLDPHPNIPFDQNWLSQLDNKMQQLTELGIEIYHNHSKVINQLITGEPQPPTEEPAAIHEEPPLEAAFESIEFAEEEPGGSAEENKELEALIEKAEALEKQKKTPGGEMSEEELKRRCLLRDYVVGEVNGFREEVVHLIERLIQDPKQEKLRKYLVDSIKALKDLGKIHNYPAIELIADRLANILQTGQEFKPAILNDLDKLFHLMREYVDANLNDADAPVMHQITRELEKLETHAEVETLPLSGADAASVKKAFFEIVRRYLGRLNHLVEAALQKERPEERQRFEKIVQNIHYWSQSLNLTAPLEFAREMGKLLAGAPFDESDFATIQTALQTLASTSELEKEKIWEHALATLQQVGEKAGTEPEAAPEVGIAEAGAAVQDVVKKQLQKLQEEATTAQDLTVFVEKRLIPVFNGLIENLKLAQYAPAVSVIQELLSKTLEWLAAVAPQVEGLTDLLRYLESRAEHLPDGWDVTIALEKLQQAFPVEQLTTELVDDQTPSSQGEATEEVREPATEEETVDIDAVFNQEAQKYCQQLKDMLSRLQTHPNDIEGWKDFTVEAHTLKGSSQMLGKMVIARLATVLEEVSEAVEGNALTPTKEVLELLSQDINAIQQVLDGELVDPQPIEEAARQLLAATETVQTEDIHEAETTAESAATDVQEKLAAEETAAPVSPEPQTAEGKTPSQKDEETYLYLKEQDPELLAIFQNEAVENLDLIQATVANLEKFTYDKKAFQDVEQAIHELHTSAKMLGFREIGKVAELLEKLVEKITSRELENWRDALPFIRRGGVVIQELMKAGKVERQQYHTIVQEIEQILESGFIPTAEPVSESAEALASAETPIENVTEETSTAEAQPVQKTEEKVQNQVIELFLQEAIEKLEEINFTLIKLEEEPDNAELQQHLMRSFHTLKGSASIVHATHIEQLTHLSEDIIEYYRQRHQALPPDFIDVLFKVADEINYITQALQQFQEERTCKFEPLIHTLQEHAAQLGLEGAPRATAEDKAVEAPVERPAPRKEEYVREVQEEPSRPREEAFVRLNMTKMDFLLNNSAELVVGHTQFKNLLERFRNVLPTVETDIKQLQEMVEHITTIVNDQKNIREKLSHTPDLDPGTLEAFNRQLENLEKFQKNMGSVYQEIQKQIATFREFARSSEDSLQKLSKTSNTLLDYIMQARLVPIGLLFRRFQRPIRDLARQFDKKIKLQITGEETELDRALVDRLYEPLLHIIRNAIDHGLETPEERRRQGKSEEGLLQIKAWRNRNQVVVEVKDDGRGIDVAKVRERAVEQGIISTQTAEQMSHEEILQLIFMPGFSTTEETTLVSGRGVGLDAVKNTIERLRGDVRVTSEPGEGTTFSIRIPISLSVIQSMLVDVNGQAYSIPLLEVEETIHIMGSEFLKKDGEYFYPYQKETLPVLYAPRILRVKQQSVPEISPGKEYPGIILQHEGRRVMLVVDRIIRREEILIKSIGRSLQHLKYIAGGAIMEDGQVVLVLDVAQIVQDYIITRGEGVRSQSRRQSRPVHKATTSQRKVKVVGRPPEILIVDDSVSIRKYVSGLFLEQGFKTETAANGREALEILKKRKIDLMITDLEMPHFNGYELIEAVRKEEKYQEMPIVVLTGRTGTKFEEMSHALGADAYINKPFRDQELIQKVKSFIIQK